MDAESSKACILNELQADMQDDSCLVSAHRGFSAIIAQFFTVDGFT